MFSGPSSGDHKVMLTVKSLKPYGLCIIPLTTLYSIFKVSNQHVQNNIKNGTRARGSNTWKGHGQ
jgi:hypothetical protein